MASVRNRKAAKYIIVMLTKLQLFNRQPPAWAMMKLITFDTSRGNIGLCHPEGNDLLLLDKISMPFP